MLTFALPHVVDRGQYRDGDRDEGHHPAQSRSVSAHGRRIAPSPAARRQSADKAEQPTDKTGGQSVGMAGGQVVDSRVDRRYRAGGGAPGRRWQRSGRPH
ncbi:hypothetical protein GCM10009541_39490 [Micromonospora gifhornensis]|uniref:Uncharacterized protein n=1 Tax=Micromonospora gifhornensis TaxID=84594 RepID=A0ABQ4IDS4_9ACTN|nr:hypothetical protein Vgi01_27490 [Micromonospora gifhornensis]